jgi:hypothetical protein
MLTIQQRMELRKLAHKFIENAGAPNPVDADKELCDFVDRLADARVVNFAEGCTRANDVAKHLENTIEQYALLGRVLETQKP